jgi:hypothetical protein
MEERIIVTRTIEEQLKRWAKPPGKIEQDKSDNAESAIKTAIKNDDLLKNRSITFKAQGSYRNRTTVRQESDVDVCILCLDSMFFELPDGYTERDFNILTPATYSYEDYRAEVHAALLDHFTGGTITQGNKAFDCHENTYRVDADAVAAFEYRRYYSNGTYLSGIAFKALDGRLIINWPEQHYANGVQKNTDTARHYKAMVRILKKLKYKLIEEGIGSADDVPSFLIECLVWNVPNEHFDHNEYDQILKQVVAFLYLQTLGNGIFRDFKEVNGIKPLFSAEQSWTRELANQFLADVWEYMEFS